MKNKNTDLSRNNKIRLFQVIVLAIIFFFVGYYFGVTKVAFDWSNYKPAISIVNKEPPSGIANVNFSTFWTVWQALTSTYYDKTKINPQNMLNGAISGMISSIGDPFTLYLPPAENGDFVQSLAGQFSGIGAELGLKGSQIIIIAPLDGSPAQQAGIRAGDVILDVNGVSTANWDLNKTVGKIRGPKGVPVVLTVLHRNSQTPVNIKIVRNNITLKSVSSWVKPVKCTSSSCKVVENASSCKSCSNIAYIQLSEFGGNTNQEWTQAVKGLVTRIHKDNNVKGLILDLRDNPGGYLSDAIFIASEFLQEGQPIASEQNSIIGTKTYYVQRHGLLTTIPLVILINKGSASASEIVSGALRDNKRAILIGQTSYGKGTVQEVLELANGAGLHITIAKWITLDGTWVNGKGLTPDITVLPDVKDPSVDIQLDKAIQYLVK